MYTAASEKNWNNGSAMSCPVLGILAGARWMPFLRPCFGMQSLAEGGVKLMLKRLGLRVHDTAMLHAVSPCTPLPACASTFHASQRAEPLGCSMEAIPSI